MKRKDAEASVETRNKRASSRAKFAIEKSAGAIVFARKAQLEYLLIYSHFWEFPKGHLDADESELDAARREIREETGLEVEFVQDFRDEINYFFRRGDKLIKKQVVFFLTRAHSRRVELSSEHNEFVWLPFDAALGKLTYENSRAVLKKANAFLVKRLTG